ncbi:MAG: NADH-quinone oxidoreductase subunit K [Kiritimatiellaeota bacterium]|nr:NADH-quinone oxidoreductase subunit K [Kiritimatiellota bacterium]
MIPINAIVALGCLVFGIGLIGVLVRKNLMVILMSLELLLNGVNILLIDRAGCRSVDVGLAIARTLHQLYPAQFNVEKLNVLLGDKPTLQAVKAGRSLDELHALWSAGLTEFQTRRLKCLLYPE